MKRLAQQLISGALALCLTLQPALAHAQQAGAPAAPAAADAGKNRLVGSLLRTIEERYDRILSKLPDEKFELADLDARARLNAELDKLVAEVRDGTISVEDLRKRAVQESQRAMTDQKDELQRQVRAMSIEELDAVAESVGKHPDYEELRTEYVAAYTRNEKANALVRAVFRDLDQLQSMMTKRSDFASKARWERELRAVQGEFNTKGPGDKKWLKVLMIAGIAVAATGLLTWGIASAVYGGRYAAKKSDRERELENLRNTLEAKYSELNNRLTAEEQQFLADNGYVWAQCGAYEQPDSILCNRYDYRLFSGSKYCTVQCYRNTATGKETLHSAPNCTSPFIPADCYDPNEWSEGYADGHDDGWDDGYSHGYDDGWYDGSDDGYDDGYDDGWDDGYDSGYADGFSDGYSSYGYRAAVRASVDTLKAVIEATRTDKEERTPAYKRGYANGLRDGRMLVGGMLQ